MILTKAEVLERLCKLSTKVMDKKFQFDIAADCFCGENKSSGIIDNYRFDEQIMEFIENAVEQSLRSNATGLQSAKVKQK